MKQIKLITILFAGLLGLMSQSASAVLIDQGDYILDTDNNLEWLKLTATDAMSASAAITTFGADGWGLSSEAQYESLFDAIFPTYTDTDGNGYESVYAGDVLLDQGAYFAELFGLTYDSGTGSSASYGFYEGTDGLLHIGGVFHDSTWKNLYRDHASSYDQYRTSIHANVGIFMVRTASVPEAASLLLLGLGLVGLGFARRKV